MNKAIVYAVACRRRWRRFLEFTGLVPLVIGMLARLRLRIDILPSLWTRANTPGGRPPMGSCFRAAVLAGWVRPRSDLYLCPPRQDRQ